MSSEDFVELKSRTAARAEGYSNTGFQNEDDFDEKQNTSGNNNSLRCRAVQNTQQDEEQVTIEQDSLRNKEDVEDDPEAHQKGYRFKRKSNHTDLLFGFATLFYLHLILNIYYYLLDITTTTTHFPSPLPTQHHFQKN